MLKPSLQKTLSFKFARRLVLIGGLSILIGVVAAAQAPVATSETPNPKAESSKDERIRVIADKLFAEMDTGVIEFVGNVKATQANTVVTADRLKIIYYPDAINHQTKSFKPESIEKIIATGHVKINYSQIVAETDEAEYTMKSEVLILKGANSKVTQAGRSITGTKFTLQRSDGKITVESSEENRVKAVFHPSAKDK